MPPVCSPGSSNRPRPARPSEEPTQSAPHNLQPPVTTTVVTDLEERGIGVRSVSEAIDTTTAGGKLVFFIFGALAEFSVISTRRGWPRRGSGPRPGRGTATEDDNEEDQAGEADARQRG
ncbi:recombinase family protein [Rhodococcus pyridinivorans]|uniref:recombinase family protein n=1 Tax=Rhodococcus pyridinivorans TaxID=103816 RepID=UPI003AAE3A94